MVQPLKSFTHNSYDFALRVASRAVSLDDWQDASLPEATIPGSFLPQSLPGAAQFPPLRLIRLDPCLLSAVFQVPLD